MKQIYTAFFILMCSSGITSADQVLIKGTDRDRQLEAAELIGIGDEYQRQLDYKEAAASYESSIAIRQKLVTLYPTYNEFTWGLGVSITRRAILHFELGEVTLSDTRLKEAIELLERLIVCELEDDTCKGYLQSYGIALSYRARILQKSKNSEGALEIYGNILNIRMKYLALEPLNIRRSADVSTTYFQIGETHFGNKKYSVAHKYFVLSYKYMKRANSMNKESDSELLARTSSGYFMAAQSSTVLAETSRAEQEYENAKYFAELALEYSPDHPMAQQVLDLAVSQLKK